MDRQQRGALGVLLGALALVVALTLALGPHWWTPVVVGVVGGAAGMVIVAMLGRPER